MHPTPHHWKAARRWPAWRLRQTGWPQWPVAEALGGRAAAVSQWVQRARMGGPQALRHQRPRGAARRLAAEPPTHLPALLRRGPKA
jgi:hypothetical protein